MKDKYGMHRIVGNLSNNIYVVERGNELVVFDPGMPSDLRRVRDRIKSLGRSPEEVSSIVLTHFHVDHAGAARALKDESGARVYIHVDDSPYLRGEKYMPSVYNAGFQGRLLMLLPGIVERYSGVPPVEADVAFDDGDVLPVLGGLEVLHSPGHTPGSSCFLWRDRGVLFTGDAIQNWGLLLVLPEGGFSYDLALAGRSAAAVVDALSDRDYTDLCPGHGPVVRGSGREMMAGFGARLRRMGKA
jgi:glyoxylase-like metal-dependent hydrolase (beta-lactamase superfamily II)